MRAISVLSFETGTSTRWCFAAAALRMRVKKSAMGSVCIMFLISLLPAGFHDAGNFSLERHAAETDAAHLKLADISAGPAADAAAVAHANLELGLLEAFGDFRGACHLLCRSFFAQREAQALQKLAAFLVVLCRGGQGDVHTLDLVHAGVIDFREHQLVLEAQGVIAAAIESVGGQPAEVAHAGQHDVAEAVEKFVHLLAAQRDRAADRHALANLEIRDGLLCLGDDRFLAGDLPELDGSGVQQLCVLAGFAEADVQGDFLNLRHGHHVLPPKALHQRRHRFFSVLLMHSTHHAFFIPSKIGPPQKAAPTKSKSKNGPGEPGPYNYLSSVVPHRLHARTRLPSAKVLWPMRVCLPQFPQTTWTFEACIGPSFSTMPPLMFFAGFGRVCRLMMLACSTMIVFFRGLIESTRPLLPASRPLNTRTLSPLRMLMV